MRDATPSPEPPAGTPDPFPPLGLGDLMLLTLTVSLAFACGWSWIKSLLLMPDAQYGGSTLQEVARYLMDFVSIGTRLFGLLVLARLRLCGIRHYLQPGHWIILATGPQALIGLVMTTLPALHRAPLKDWVPKEYMLQCIGILAAVYALLLILAGRVEIACHPSTAGLK